MASPVVWPQPEKMLLSLLVEEEKLLREEEEEDAARKKLTTVVLLTAALILCDDDDATAMVGRLRECREFGKVGNTGATAPFGRSPPKSIKSSNGNTHRSQRWHR